MLATRVNRSGARRSRATLPTAVWCLLLMAAGCSRASAPHKPRGDAGAMQHDAGRTLRDGATSADAAATSPDGATEADAGAPGPTRISVENEQPGDDGLNVSMEQSAQLSAYASAISVAAGESLQLFVHVAHAQDVSYQVYRAGYYQGHGARLVSKGASARVSPQPDCPPQADTGLVECHWAAAFDVQTDASWVSGYYALKLHSQDGYETLVPLIVREPVPRAAIVVQASVNTWQAYNSWGGTSLYKNRDPEGAYKLAHAHQVSFDRPFEPHVPGFLNELSFVRFAEQRGYDMAYVANPDVTAGLLDQRKLFVSLWHDEYWSVEERRALDAARDAGTSLLFLSANTGYWRVRYESDARRVMTCYKSASDDPISSAPETTAQFRQSPSPHPENALLGIMYGAWSDFGGFPFLVRDAEHWIYRGTGVREREALGALIGVEWDSVVDNGHTPEGLEVVADSPAVAQIGTPFSHVHASVYYPTPRSFVFAAGSITWVTGLAGRHADPRVQRMAENLFERAGFAAPHTDLQPRAAEPAASSHSRVLAGQIEGYADGQGQAARFSSPTGLAVDADGQLYVADTGNALIRKIDAEGNVTTFAGCAPSGSETSSLCFKTPIGLAFDHSGDLFVSDAGRSLIFRVDKQGQVSKYAGSGEAGARDAAELTSAQFKNPRGLAWDAQGSLYVADFGNNAVRAIRADTGVTTLLSELAMVTGIAAADGGKLYFTSYKRPLGVISDAQAHDWVGSTIAPIEGLALSDDGVVIADAGNNRVVRVPFGSDKPQLLLGDGHGGDEPHHLSIPRAVARAGDHWAISDSGQHRIVLLEAR